MGLTPLQRYSFDLRGYLLIEDVLDRAALGALRQTIAAQRLPAPGEGVMEQRFSFAGEMLGWHQAFRDLIDHPVMVDVLDALIGPYARLDHVYGIMMRPGQRGLGLHGPAWPFDPAQYYLHRHGHMRSGLLACAWALTDGRSGDGGFGCIPGSHRADEPFPAGAEELTVEVTQPAGSLLVFTEALVHCTIPWLGRGDRYALLYKYSPGNSTWSPRAAANPDVLDALTPRQRALLEPPYVGGRPPSLGDPGERPGMG